MSNYEESFVRLALDAKILKVGSFTMKSGKPTHYFFNTGDFKTGAELDTLGSLYAQRIVQEGIEFDVLFGSAYKGIPLVSATICALHREHSIEKLFAYDRKEAKDHGEGGNIIGAPLQGRVLIIDDVLSSGKTIRESTHMIEGHGAQVVGAVIALDREESMDNPDMTARDELTEALGFPVFSIARISALVAEIKANDYSAYPEAQALLQYVDS